MAIHLHTFDKDLQNAKIDEHNICKEKLRLYVIETCAIDTHILIKQIFIKRTQTQTYSGSKIPLLTQKKLKLYSSSNIKCVEYVQNIPRLKKYLYTINTSFPTQKRETRTPTPP